MSTLEVFSAIPEISVSCARVDSAITSLVPKPASSNLLRVVQRLGESAQLGAGPAEGGADAILRHADFIADATPVQRRGFHLRPHKRSFGA